MRRRTPSSRLQQFSGGNSGSAPWLTTYSDVVTLLLCFFVLLFAFSEVDVQRFRAILAAFQASLGVLDGGRSVMETQPDMSLGSGVWDLRDVQFYRPELEAQLRALYTEVQEFIRERGLDFAVEVGLTDRGVVLRLAEGVFFDLGKADLRPDARRVLDELAVLVRAVPNPVRVEGHTDNLPIRTERFPSNWELSTARATNVVRYLIEEHGLDPRRLSAAGYGEYRPVAPNDSDANRARNRRVDIVLLRLDLGEYGAGGADSPPREGVRGVGQQ